MHDCIIRIIELVQYNSYASPIYVHHNRMVHEYTDVLVLHNYIILS